MSTGTLIADHDGGHREAGSFDADHPMSQMDLPPACRDLAGNRLPHLARPELGVEEALDKTGLGACLRSIRRGAKGSGKRVRKRFGHGQSFDPLCSPGSIDFRAGHAPHLLRVSLEERQVKAPSEAIHKKVLERVLWELWRE